MLRDVTNPAVDCVPIGFQTLGDLAIADALLVQIPVKNYLRFLIHVRSIHRIRQSQFLKPGT